MRDGNHGVLCLGELFDTYAHSRHETVFRLSRPFDIAPAGGTEYDAASLAVLVEDAAGWLCALGARAGDRVAIVKDNHWDYVLLACAAARLGAVPAMVSDHLPADALQMLIKRLAPTVLVTTAGVLRRAQDRAELAGLVPRTLTTDAGPPGTVSIDEVRGSAAPRIARRGPDEPMIITHTSGTTGLPKLVVHSANTAVGHLGRTESIRWPVISMRRDDTVATAVAFAHTRILPWTTGTMRLEPRQALIVAGSDPAEAGRLFRSAPPTYLEALPSTYIGWEPLAEGRESPFADVRVYVSTFDAVHPPTVRCFLAASRRRFPVWFQGWGQSETGPLAFRLLTRSAVARRGVRHPTTRDLGRPIPFLTRLRAVDPITGRPLPPGRPGLLSARTNGRCLSYFDEDARWRSKTDGSWWHTGDLGVRTRTGRILLHDREIDLIPGMSGVEVEDVLADRLPQVLEAIVLGVPGGLPKPVLCTEDGRLDQDRWRQAIRDLPELDEPTVLTWHQVPRTGTGKVRRQQLRQRVLGSLATYGTGRWT